MVDIECADEIADAAGRKVEGTAISEAAMRGEIADYNESLLRRVALLTRLASAPHHSDGAARAQLPFSGS